MNIRCRSGSSSSGAIHREPSSLRLWAACSPTRSSAAITSRSSVMNTNAALELDPLVFVRAQPLVRPLEPARSALSRAKFRVEVVPELRLEQRALEIKPLRGLQHLAPQGLHERTLRTGLVLGHRLAPARTLLARRHRHPVVVARGGVDVADGPPHRHRRNPVLLVVGALNVPSAVRSRRWRCASRRSPGRRT
jgi:hypothetical protein